MSVRRPRRGAARGPRPVLGRVRRRARRRRRAPAGRPVQPVQPVPVGGPRRADEHRGQGPHGRGLRGPLLLGHRDLRAAVLRLHPAGHRALAAPVPGLDARQGAGAGRRAEPARRPLPVADDRRRGGVRVLPRRHGPVPHRCRHLVRDPALRHGDRRPVAAARGRRRDRVRDGAAVGRPRRLHRRAGRRLLHQRGDRAGRVHGARQQQRVHEPHGAREPALRGAAGRRAPRRGARDVVRAHRGDRARRRPRWGSGRGPRTRCGSRATRPSGSTPRTTRSSTARRGTSRARRATATRCCSTTTRS